MTMKDFMQTGDPPLFVNLWPQPLSTIFKPIASDDSEQQVAGPVNKLKIIKRDGPMVYINVAYQTMRLSVYFILAGWSL
jgi:hypothetical protein